MKDLIGNPVGAGALIVGAILLQVFVPALFDIVVSIAIAAGGFLLGRATKGVSK
jgi:hypothetical protein